MTAIIDNTRDTRCTTPALPIETRSAGENKETFFDRFRAHATPKELALLDSAYRIAKNEHRGQLRSEGCRYFEHPRAVALILADELGVTDIRVIILALLHDLLEDTHYFTQAMLEVQFGSEITTWIVAISKLPGESLTEYTKRVEEGGLEVMIVKLADRLHNIRSVKWCDQERQDRYLRETTLHYLPFADTFIDQLRDEDKVHGKKLKALIEQVLDEDAHWKADIEKGFKYVVVCQEWTEHERGWGQRPDGYSLHKTEEEAKIFIRNYWDRMLPRDSKGNPPDEYSAPEGTPFTCLVDAETMRKIVESDRHGVWLDGATPSRIDGFEPGAKFSVEIK